MKRAAIFLMLMIIAPTTLRAQTETFPGSADDDEVLRVSTNIVTVPATVKTRNGAYVSNLVQENFRIFEDGVEQKIAHFEPVDQPFTITLMLDVSDSAKGELRNIQDAAIAFLNQLQPNDRALIIAFDKRFVRLTEVTGDRKVLSDAIRRVQTGGGTALYDAVDTVINERLKRIPGRKAIVLLTDGIDTSSVRTTYDGTISSAAEQYALIYPIQWNSADSLLSKQLASGNNSPVLGGVTYVTPSGEPIRKAYERGTRYLQLIAQTSGGQFHYADSIKNLERSFARIAQELRQQYSLSYYPQNRNPKSVKRRIKISVSVPDAVVHARAGYNYQSDGN